MRCDYLKENLPALEAWIKMVNVKACGRTRYEGQTPFPDELAVSEIDHLRQRNAELELKLKTRIETVEN